MNIRRRQFLTAGATFGITGLAAGIPAALAAEQKEAGEMKISPTEDLMREHGVLKRILLVYGEAVRRLDANEDLPPKTTPLWILEHDARGADRSFHVDGIGVPVDRRGGQHFP